VYGFPGERTYAYPAEKAVISNEQAPMSKQTMCADNLFLLGELLQGAGEYMTRSKNHADDEDRFMIELAREQIPQLRLALRTLDKSLTELDGQLRARLKDGEKSAELPAKPERRARKASSGG
jgi:hypothetical protein